MARVVLALCLLLALAAAVPAPPYEAQSEEVEWEEEQRAGQEEQWQAEGAAPIAPYEEQLGGDAPEEYQQRDNTEQLTQQVHDTQGSDEGSLSRLTAESQGLQQFEQQSGQLQQQFEQQRGQLQQQSDQQYQQTSGQLQQQSDQQYQQTSGQLQQQSDKQYQQESGRLQQQQQQRDQLQQNQQQSSQPDRLVDGSQGSQGSQQVNNPSNSDFGIVRGNNVSPPQSGSSQPNPGGYTPYRPPSPSSPPVGYTSVGSYGYFKAFLTPLTWPEALMTCVADGALLAVPSSLSEAVAVGEFYGKVKNQVKKSQDKDLFFIGASDLHKENSFVTLIGTQFGKGQWHRWQKGEPNNHKKVEHCVLSNDKAFYWDGNCQAKYAFVCQIKDRCKPDSPRFDELQQSSNLQQQSQSSQSRY